MPGHSGGHETLTSVIRDLLATPEIVWAVFDNRVTVEGFTNEKSTFEVEGDYATLDSEGWHMHLAMSQVGEVRFIKADDPHHGKDHEGHPRISFSVQFGDKEGKRIVGAYFMKMYDDAGHLRPERVGIFERMFQKYGSQEVIVLASSA